MHHVLHITPDKQWLPSQSLPARWCSYLHLTVLSFFVRSSFGPILSRRWDIESWICRRRSWIFQRLVIRISRAKNLQSIVRTFPMIGMFVFLCPKIASQEYRTPFVTALLTFCWPRLVMINFELDNIPAHVACRSFLSRRVKVPRTKESSGISQLRKFPQWSCKTD